MFKYCSLVKLREKRQKQKSTVLFANSYDTCGHNGSSAYLAKDQSFGIKVFLCFLLINVLILDK